MIAEPIHFIGIGGIGMSAIAQALLEQGYKVSGSDIKPNINIERIQQLGAKVFIGHDPAHIKDAQTIVISTAVKDTNPEYQEAIAKNYRILHRSEMLADLISPSKEKICIAGSHGKTTTTTMMAGLFEHADRKPSVINGGIMNAYGTNAKLGDPNCFIIEADESDGSMIRFSPSVAVILNIDSEHMDHYGDFDSLMAAFQTFAENTPHDGWVVLGIDHPNVQLLKQRLHHPQITTYGFSEDAEFRAVNLDAKTGGLQFDVLHHGTPLLRNVFLNAYGEHNVLNALATIAVGSKRSVSQDYITQSLESFQGVQRRFTSVGEWNHITFIDDYAHHPTEIEMTLKAASEACSGNLIAVLQPHRYSRLAHHFGDFAKSCHLATKTIVLPVFAAGESPIPGVSHTTLAAQMPGDIILCDKEDDLPKIVQGIASPGDIVVCMGAGNITTMARNLPQQLTQFSLHNAMSA